MSDGDLLSLWEVHSALFSLFFQFASHYQVISGTHSLRWTTSSNFYIYWAAVVIFSLPLRLFLLAWWWRACTPLWWLFFSQPSRWWTTGSTLCLTSGRSWRRSRLRSQLKLQKQKKEMKVQVPMMWISTGEKMCFLILEKSSEMTALWNVQCVCVTSSQG